MNPDILTNLLTKRSRLLVQLVNKIRVVSCLEKKILRCTSETAAVGLERFVWKVGTGNFEILYRFVSQSVVWIMNIGYLLSVY